ncbi:PREDICTED: uncharacterized protein LOC101370147 [Odobenus rosmarus divergens]|uniref:Uncharacterized protein LOC101370147 n=1 Tax=Odobenus rosmarus divergens TaxID=9708 RepID=A0A9B0GYE2_ODORO
MKVPKGIFLQPANLPGKVNKWQDFCKFEPPASAAARSSVPPARALPRAPSRTLAHPRAPSRTLAHPRQPHVTLIDSPAPPLSFPPTFPSTVPISASPFFLLAGFGVPRLLQEQFFTEPGRTRLAEEGYRPDPRPPPALRSRPPPAPGWAGPALARAAAAGAAAAGAAASTLCPASPKQPTAPPPPSHGRAGPVPPARTSAGPQRPKHRRDYSGPVCGVCPPGREAERRSALLLFFPPPSRGCRPPGRERTLQRAGAPFAERQTKGRKERGPRKGLGRRVQSGRAGREGRVRAGRGARMHPGIEEQQAAAGLLPAV